MPHCLARRARVTCGAKEIGILADHVHMSRVDPDAVLAEIETVYRTRYVVFWRVATAIVGDSDQARDAVHGASSAALRHRMYCAKPS